MSPWCEKYRPTCIAEIKGQDIAVDKVKRFLKDFGKGKNSIILYGPPGTGKTTIAYAVAKEADSEIFELNASDLRNKEQLEKILKPVMQQKSIKKDKKIILIDEVDGISETDRGGLLELLGLLEKTKYPIIITANDIWDKKFNVLRRKSEMLNLKEVEYKIIKGILIEILKKEKLFIDDKILTTISVKAKGDVRAAINDLQAIAYTKDFSLITIDERNKEKTIFSALNLVFKNRPSKETLEVYDSVNLSIDEIALWVEENIPLEYKGEELFKAIELLSKADIFKGRIYRQQYWRFLLYQNIFLSYGISSVKDGIKTDFTKYQKPSRILKIWMNNQRIEKKKTIARKYANYAHIGEKRALSEFPILKQILKDEGIRKELKLEEDEIAYLEGLKSKNP